MHLERSSKSTWWLVLWKWPAMFANSANSAERKVRERPKKGWLLQKPNSPKKLLQSLKFIIIANWVAEVRCCIFAKVFLIRHSPSLERCDQILKRHVGEEDQEHKNIRVEDNHLQTESFPCRCSIFLGWSMSHQSLLSPPLMQSSIFNTTFTRFAF